MITPPARLNLKAFVEKLTKILEEHGDIHLAFYDGYEEAVSIPRDIESYFTVYSTTDEAIKATYTKDWNWIERAVNDDRYETPWEKDSKVLVVRCSQ